MFPLYIDKRVTQRVWRASSDDYEPGKRQIDSKLMVKIYLTRCSIEQEASND
jgi:hypothetical protein